MDAYKFLIRGEIDSYYGYGPVQLEESLKSANGRDLFIDIDSVGGCVNTGMTLYAMLRRYAKENNAIITTRTSGFVASIATAIFLAGDKRIVNEFLQPFVHNPQLYWSEETEAEGLKKEAEGLEKAQNMLAEFYEKNTLMTKDQALDIMANDTWLTAQECMDLGFATEIEELSKKEAKIVASIKSKMLTNNNSKMSEKKKNVAWYLRLANVMTPAKAELTLASVDDQTVTFPDLEDGATPSVGDSIVVDEDASFTGEVETNNYVIQAEDGKVTVVIDKTEVDLDEVVETLIETNEGLEAKIKKLEAEKEKYAKLYNSLGGKTPESGKRKAKNPDSDPADAKKQKALDAIEKIKNKIDRSKK